MIGIAWRSDRRLSAAAGRFKAYVIGHYMDDTSYPQGPSGTAEQEVEQSSAVRTVSVTRRSADQDRYLESSMRFRSGSRT